MVIEFSSGIRNFDQNQRKSLARLLSDASDRGHFIEMSYPDRRWFEKEFLGSDLYYSLLDKEIMREAIGKWQAPASMSRILSHVTFGDNPADDIAGLDAIINEKSLVIVENGYYDWSAIKRWIELYRKKKGYADINLLVFQNASRRILDAANGGGKDNIPNEATRLMPRYNGYHQVKLASIFDSDRTSGADIDHNSVLKQKLDTRDIGWHELEKRALENYFDWDCYAAIGCVTGSRPAHIDEETWDYLHIQNFINRQLDKAQRLNEYTKPKMVDLSAATDRQLMTSRLAHVGRTPDEIQAIILFIAKII